MLVEHSVKDQLASHLRDAVVRMRSGEADMQKIVNERQYRRLVDYLEQTTGTVVLGGRHDDASISIEPTIVVDPAPTDAVMQDEIFGPLLPIIGIDNADTAVDFINRRPKPLAFYVFAGSLSVARGLVRSVPAGGAVINHVAMHCLVPTLPFGGVGPSGMGAYHGRWGFETFSHRKAVLTKTTRPDLRLVYPPYGDFATKVLRRLF